MSKTTSGVDLDESFFVRTDQEPMLLPKKSTSEGCLKSKKTRRWLICVGIFLVFLGVMIPVTILVIVPSFAQSMIDNSQLMLMNATMTNPTNETIEMNTFLEMSTPDTGMFTALVSQTQVNVGTSKGDFGYLDMPKMQVDSSQLWINMTSTLHVTNVLLFTEATASVLQGKPEPWIIRGSPDVRLKLGGSTIRFSVNLAKQFDLPKTLFVQMQASNAEIVSTSSDRVVAKAQSSFFSSSVLEMKNIGDMTFNVSDIATGVWLGEVTVKNFQAVRDFNVLPDCEVSFIQLPDKSNEHALKLQIQKFLNGEDQAIQMNGPVRSAAPFLSDIVSQVVTIKGSKLISHAIAEDMVIRSTSANYINATVTSSFYSETPMSIAAIGGPQTMSLILDGVEIGFFGLDQDVVVGFNSFESTSSLHCEDGDSACWAAANKFLSAFSRGETQTLRISGPKNPPVSFMVGVVDAEIQVHGSRLMDSVTASNFAIVSTNATHMWTTSSVSFVSQSPITMDAVGGSLTMQMESVNGDFLGHVLIENDVTLGLNTVDNVRSVLFINGDNQEAIRSFLRVLGSGTVQTAVLTGPVAGGSPLLYNTLRQNSTMRGAVMMSNVVASNVITTGGTDSSLTSTSTTTMVSGMNVPKGATGGPMEFQMIGEGDEVLGTVSVDYDVIVGYNSVPSICTLTKTETNENAISAFLGHFLSGEEQVIGISGPVNTVAPFMSNIFSTTSVVMPQTQPMVYFAVENQDTITGYSVQVDGKSVTYRGSMVTLLNPFPVHVKVSNMISDMYMMGPLSFDFTFTFVKRSCPPSNLFTRQLTAKGMYKDKVDQDYVEVPPMSTTAFFSPSIPQPPQATMERCSIPGMVDLPCCFLAVPIAAACHANSNGMSHIMLSSNGTYTLDIDGFVTNVPFSQKNVTVVYDAAVLAGFLKDDYISCKSFTWH